MNRQTLQYRIIWYEGTYRQSEKTY